MDGCRNMMALMALAGEDDDEVLDEYDETRDGEEEAEDDRRKGLRRLDGEKRAVTAWRREECMTGGLLQ